MLATVICKTGVINESSQAYADGHPIIGHYVIEQSAHHQSAISCADVGLMMTIIVRLANYYFSSDASASPVPHEPRSLTEKHGSVECHLMEIKFAAGL